MLGIRPYRDRIVPVNGALWSLLPFAMLAAVLTIGVHVGNRALLDLVAVVLVFPVILALGIAFEPPAALRRTFALLGEVSYPVYAIPHPLAFVAMLVAIGLNLSFPAALIGFLSALGASALILARGYDAPARTWPARRMQRGASLMADQRSPSRLGSAS